MPLEEVGAIWHAMPQHEKDALMTSRKKHEVKIDEVPDLSSMPPSQTPLGIGGPSYPVTDSIADEVSKNVRELHEKWCQHTRQPIPAPATEEEETIGPTPAQCGELYGHGVCGSLLSAHEKADHARITRQLCRLVTMPEQDGPGMLKFLELIFVEPELEPNPRQEDLTLLMITKYKKPMYPIFCMCKNVGILQAGVEVQIQLSAPIVEHIFTAPMLAMRLIQRLPRGTHLRLSRCEYIWKAIENTKRIDNHMNMEEY